MICGALRAAHASKSFMKSILPLCAVVVLLVSVSACSKKSAGNPSAGTPASGDSNALATVVPVAAPTSPAASAAVNSLPQVAQAIESRQYENAVQTLVQLKPATAQMTDAQRLQYQQAVRDATTALLGVKDRDPAAKAAYDKLSRAATGR